MFKFNCFLLVAILLFVGGCASRPFVPPEACLDSPSLIVERIPDVQALDRGLLTIQLAALEKVKGYDYKDALAVIDQIEEMADASKTYATLVAYVARQVDLANRLAGAVIFIIGEDLSTLNEDVPISDCDRLLVKKHLDKQRALIAFYTVK